MHGCTGAVAIVVADGEPLASRTSAALRHAQAQQPGRRVAVDAGPDREARAVTAAPVAAWKLLWAELAREHAWTPGRGIISRRAISLRYVIGGARRLGSETRARTRG